EQMVDRVSRGSGRARWDFHPLACDIQCGRDFPAGFSWCRFSPPVRSDLAAYCGRICRHGRDDLDRRRVAATIRFVTRTELWPIAVALDGGHAVYAWDRRILVAPCNSGCAAADAGDGRADGCAHSIWGAGIWRCNPSCVDVLSAGSTPGNSGGNVPPAGSHRMSTLRTSELTLLNRAGAYVALTKPDVSFLVLMTTTAGYYMGARGPVDWLKLVHTIFGTMLIAAGTAALNHYIERESDRHMRRTASRPLPSGLLQPAQALWFGVALAIAGAADLWLVGGWLTSLLGIVTCLGYLLAYTPLKKRTVWATFVGA